jgi:hypothetical protein
MRTISVTIHPPSPTFSSAIAAIRHVERSPRRAQAKADEQLLRGSQIIDGFWSDSDCAIRFSNGRLLHIHAAPSQAGGRVDWAVLDAEPDLGDCEIRRVGCEPIVLQFSAAVRYTMDLSAMVAARRGKDFRALYANDGQFYLYTPRQQILCFGRVQRADTGGGMLYVYEDD